MALHMPASLLRSSGVGAERDDNSAPTRPAAVGRPDRVEVDALTSGLQSVRLASDDAPWQPTPHGFVRVYITPKGEMGFVRVRTPPVATLDALKNGDFVAPEEACDSFLRTLSEFREKLSKLTPYDLQSLRQKARRADVLQLHEAHGPRLGVDMQHAQPPFVTPRGTILRLLEMMLGMSRNPKDESIKLSVHLRPGDSENSTRTTAIFHGNPRVRYALYDKNWTNKKGLPNGHLTGALVPPAIIGVDARFVPSETMRLLSARCGGRLLLLWAEVNAVDVRTGSPIEITTRLNWPEHLLSTLAGGAIQCMLAGIEQLWVYSHYKGKLESADAVLIPRPSFNAPDFVPTVCGARVDDERLRALPRRFLPALDGVVALFRSLEEAALASPVSGPASIFHVTVTVTGGETADASSRGLSFSFDVRDFDSAHSEYYVYE